MKTLKFTLAFFTAIVFLFPFTANSQQEFKCGTDEARRKLIEQHPEILQQENNLEQFTRDFVINYYQQKGSRSSCPYILPVVFHIMHQGGIENISDAQINDAMRILNEDYNKRNADIILVIPPFRAIVANVGVEFRLANIDPNGNVCNGIDRIYSVQSVVGNDYSKLNSWPREKYLNVWTTKAIGEAGAAGYSYYPGSVDALYSTPNRDGVILLHDYIGSIGTSSPYKSRALTHEVGHYLNLKHVWGDNNEPGQACGDDNVNDTPETKGWLNCPQPVWSYRDSLGTHTISPSKLDSLWNANPLFVIDSIYRSAMSCVPHVSANYQNFMEYSYCSVMFSNEQGIRMIAALNSTLSDRNNLWTCANLSATGVDDTTYEKPAPIADFSVTKRFVCLGQNVQFKTATDASEVDSYEWTFSNASVSTSIDRDPIVQFNTNGWQTVTLKVTNTAGYSAKTKTELVFVSYDHALFQAPFTQGFEDPYVFNSGWGSANYDNNNTAFTYSNQGAHAGTGCAVLNNYYATVDRDVDEVVSPGYDLTQLTTTQRILTFDYSWASTAQSFALHTADSMNVFASTDCGVTWSNIYKKGTHSGTAVLLNAGSINGYFTPTNAQLWWKQVSIPLSNVLIKPNVMFRFQVMSSVGGNNFYIDNINIGTPLTAIEDLSSVSVISIFPNPTHGDALLNLNLSKAGNISVKVYDMQGKEAMNVFEGWLNAGETQLTIDGSSKLSSGVYTVNGKAGESVIQKKLVIQ